MCLFSFSFMVQNDWLTDNLVKLNEDDGRVHCCLSYLPLLLCFIHVWSEKCGLSLVEKMLETNVHLQMIQLASKQAPVNLQ